MKLFTYGTLQPEYAGGNGYAVDIMNASRRWERWSTRGMMYSIDGRYPAVIFGGEGIVYGTVWHIPDSVWVGLVPLLDSYEGVPHLYQRVWVNRSTQSYEWSGSMRKLTPVASGNWIKHLTGG